MFKIELSHQQIVDLLVVIAYWLDKGSEDKDIIEINNRLRALYTRLNLKV